MSSNLEIEITISLRNKFKKMIFTYDIMHFVNPMIYLFT